jgi:hypothetical protein
MTTSRILGNFASAFFFASGCWTDLFLIRVFCSCAYICIIAFHFSIQSQEYEMYVWGFLSLYLHGSSAIRLMLEESPVQLDKNQELLWCYLYRHSGISRLLFKRYIANRFELCDISKVRYPSIYILSSIVFNFLELKHKALLIILLSQGTKLDTNSYFYIILDGAVKIDSTVSGTSLEFILKSGEPFDLKHLKPSRHAFLKQNINAVTMLDSKIFCCSEKNMNMICSQREVKDASQGLLIAALSDIAIRVYKVNEHSYDAENQSVEETETFKRSPLFAPLEEFEYPKLYLAGSGARFGIHHLLYTFKKAFLLPWPFMTWIPGIRQVGSLPVPKARLSDDSVGGDVCEPNAKSM